MEIVPATGVKREPRILNVFGTDNASFRFNFSGLQFSGAHLRSKKRNAKAIKNLSNHMGSVSGTPVALIVEDEVIVRLHIADIVEGAGFSAVEAFNADDAIALLTSRSDIRVVITDVNMHGPMDGLKLAHAVRD